jgi:hypothetical protein
LKKKKKDEKKKQSARTKRRRNRTHINRSDSPRAPVQHTFRVVVWFGIDAEIDGIIFI